MPFAVWRMQLDPSDVLAAFQATNERSWSQRLQRVKLSQAYAVMISHVESYLIVVVTYGLGQVAPA